MTRRYDIEQARLVRSAYDQYALPADLDEAARTVLGRAQSAIDAVLGSKVHKAGMLDHVGNRVVLPHLEWEIASALHRVSDLRRHHPELGHIDSQSPASHALTETVAGIERRVTALEEYAEQVKAADAVYALAPLEARQPHSELGGLTGQAQATTEALRDLVQRATHTAGRLPQIR